MNHNTGDEELTEWAIYLIITRPERPEVEESTTVSTVWPYLAISEPEIALLTRLPPTLVLRLRKILEKMEFQITQWLSVYYELVPDILYTSILPMRFLPNGTLNKVAIAEAIATAPPHLFHVVCKFRMACIYTLMPHLKNLWDEMRPEDFHGKDIRVIRQREPPLVAYWSCVLLGDYHEMTQTIGSQTMNEFGLSESCKLFGSKNSAIFFWGNHTEPIDVQSLLKNITYSDTFQSSFRSDVLYFVLDQLTGEQQRRLLVEDNLHLLRTVLTRVCQWMDLDWFRNFCYESKWKNWSWLSYFYFLFCVARFSSEDNISGLKMMLDTIPASLRCVTKNKNEVLIEILSTLIMFHSDQNIARYIWTFVDSCGKPNVTVAVVKRIWKHSVNSESSALYLERLVDLVVEDREGTSIFMELMTIHLAATGKTELAEKWRTEGKHRFIELLKKRYPQINDTAQSVDTPDSSEAVDQTPN